MPSSTLKGTTLSNVVACMQAPGNHAASHDDGDKTNTWVLGVWGPAWQPFRLLELRSLNPTQQQLSHSLPMLQYGNYSHVILEEIEISKDTPQ